MAAAAVSAISGARRLFMSKGQHKEGVKDGESCKRDSLVRMVGGVGRVGIDAQGGGRIDNGGSRNGDERGSRR